MPIKIGDILVLIGCCTDEISDLIYIILNWNSFANEGIKVASMVFFILPFGINFIFSFYLLYQNKNIKANRLAFWSMIIFFGWIPICLLYTLLIWTKILDVMRHYKVLDSFEDIQSIKQILSLSLYIELFVEDIPQLVVQNIYNTLTGTWNAIAIISLIFSVAVLVYALLRFTGVIKEKDQQ